jgi:hypothetical protein
LRREEKLVSGIQKTEIKQDLDETSRERSQVERGQRAPM